MALVATFVLAYRPAAWNARPELTRWRSITAGRPRDELYRWLGDACIEAYQVNVKQLRRKAALVGATLWILAGEAAALTIAVLAPLF